MSEIPVEIKTEVEQPKEYIPGIGEVRRLVSGLINGESEELPILYDKVGLCVYRRNEIIPTGSNLYTYVRKGQHQDGNGSDQTLVHVGYADTEGNFTGGRVLAKLEGNQWQLITE